MARDVLRAWLVLAVLALAHPGGAGGRGEVELETDTYSSAKACGRCHKEIFRRWRSGMHAMAYTDPIFQMAFMRAYWQTRGQAGPECLPCHAPTIAVTGDHEAELPISAEGVTCDFCHSLQDVHPDRVEGRFDIELGVKHGPHPDLESPAHAIRHSSLFVSSKLCAGCHEWTNRRGAHLLSTYSEWAASPYASQGRTCQSCHMPIVEGSIVDARVKRSQVRINEHDLSGGHSSAQVKKALKVRPLEIHRDGSMVNATVTIDNVGSGHHIPTGLPTRVVVLTLTASTDRGVFFREEYLFRKEVVDEVGRVLVDDADVMLNAARVIRDNRIPAGESAVKTFRFLAPTDREVTVNVTVHYRYQPELPQQTSMRIEISNAEAVVRRASLR